LFRAERDGWRKKRLHAALLVFRDDGGACVATHQLVVHQVIIAEEQTMGTDGASSGGMPGGRITAPENRPRISY
jgi:hypothetical protein